MRASSVTGCLLGGLLHLLRGLLIALLAIATFVFVVESFLVNLNARPVATAIVGEAGSEFATPLLIKQVLITAAYKDVQAQAVAQPHGSVYFPLIILPLPASSIAGKDASVLLQQVYLQIEGAYYDQPDHGIFGFTPPQAQQPGLHLSQICADVDKVLTEPNPNGTLPPDLSQILAGFGGGNGTGSPGNKSGSGNPPPLTAAQRQQQTLLLQTLQKLCAPIKGGNGLSIPDLLTLAQNLSKVSGSTGSKGPGGFQVPNIPDLASNPLVGLFGLVWPLSSTFEHAATFRQYIMLGIAALLALFLVLLSHGWGRLARVGIGILIGGLLSLVPLIAFRVFTSNNATVFQPHAVLLQMVVNQYALPAVLVTIAGGLAVLVPIGGVITRKILAARASQATAASGASPAPALVGAFAPPPFSQTLPTSADAPTEPLAPTFAPTPHPTLPVASTNESTVSTVPFASAEAVGVPLSASAPPATAPEPPVDADLSGPSDGAGPSAESPT